VRRDHINQHDSGGSEKGPHQSALTPEAMEHSAVESQEEGSKGAAN
jgi:hypothetical protein